MIESYKDLIVWQKAVSLVTSIYEISKVFPKEEMFGLTSQLRRCAVSIPSNIAEGRQRKTSKDFIQFLRIALGSCAELETQLIIACNLNYVSDAQISDILQKNIEIMKILNTIIRKLTANS